jgi:hypothetical protein
MEKLDWMDWILLILVSFGAIQTGLTAFGINLVGLITGSQIVAGVSLEKSLCATLGISPILLFIKTLLK